MQLTGGQKNKWIRLKKELLKRPLLITILPYNKDILYQYLTNTFPEKEIIERVDSILLKKRSELCDTLREELSIVVPYREAPHYSKLIGISDTIIRNIIDDKLKTPVSFDTILKIEVYLHLISNYEISELNKSLLKPYLDNVFCDLSNKLRKVSEEIFLLSSRIDSLKHKLIERDIYGDVSQERSLVQNYLNYNLKEHAKAVENFHFFIDRFK